MKKFYLKRNLAIAVMILFSGLSIYSVTGPAGTYSANVTGAPFDAGTCTNCHAPGSNYNAVVSLQLLSGGSPVTSYVPGGSYTLCITRSAPGLTSLSGGFGFQTTCATSAADININNWGTLPANTANISLNSRNYVEHTSKFSNSITQVNIPWTAPASGTGSVTFYTALNTVNGNGNNSGDQVVATSLSITESPLPITWLYFKAGKSHEGSVVIEWAAENEMNNDHYTLERSNDGKLFSLMANIKAKKSGGSYSYVDEAPYAETYYRIKQTDVDGKCEYYKTIKVQTQQYSNSSHYVQGADVVIEMFSGDDRFASVRIFDMNGKQVKNETVRLHEGQNKLHITKPSSNGIYLLEMTSNGRKMYVNKLLLM